MPLSSRVSRDDTLAEEVLAVERSSLSTGTGLPHSDPTSSATWAFVRDELLAMSAEDVRVRSELAADGSLFHGYHPRMRAVHDTNASRLTTILDAHGWPGERQVGRDGALAAWLIVQHAIGHPALQRRALELLQAAVRHGDAPPLHAAMLEDRIRVFEGRHQLYGTQFDWDSTGQLSPLPIEDPTEVGARRRALGLEPLEQQVKDVRAAAAREGERPPADWAAHQREIEAWYREVGWRS
ncbi:MAG TPA: DUF6624 domain-containing protein [Gemmatimonadales bacterium]|nr:DUF6624 domain-containing protein [Gemmatimonadales bacterium]